jgi:hypothetical protein
MTRDEPVYDKPPETMLVSEHQKIVAELEARSEELLRSVMRVFKASEFEKQLLHERGIIG